MNPFSHWIRWPPQLPNSMRMFCLSRTPWSVHAPLALSRGVDEVMIFLLVDPGSWRWQNAVSSWVPGTPEVSLIAWFSLFQWSTIIIQRSGQVLSLVKVSSSIEGQHWPTPIYSEFPLKEGSPWQMMINGNQTDGETLVTPEVVTIFIILLISQLFLANENFHGMPVAVHFPHRDIGVTAHWLSPLAVTRLYHKPTWETYLYHWMYIPVDG